MRVVIAVPVLLLVFSAAASAEVRHYACRALTPWNGGAPAKTSFAMLLDVDTVKQTVRLQQDETICCHTYDNTSDAEGEKSSVSMDVNKVRFGMQTSATGPDIYSFDLYSGILTHDFGPSAGMDRHIISTFQCIDVETQKPKQTPPG